MNETFENETWRPVQGFEGQYEVSDLGRVRSLNYHGKKGAVGILLPTINPRNGYVQACLRRSGKGTMRYVHRLVAQAFLPNPDNLEQVHHIDHDKKNCKASNLCWMSRKDNNSTEHARRLKSKSRKVGHKLHLCVRAEKDGEVRYFLNARVASNELCFSHVLAIKVLRGEFSKAKGWTLTYIPRDSDEARASGLDLRPVKIRRREERQCKRTMKRLERRLLKFKKMHELNIERRKVGSISKRRSNLKKELHIVLQCDAEGNVIREWKNAYTATRELHLNRIYDALNGILDSTGGFIWKYKVEG